MLLYYHHEHIEDKISCNLFFVILMKSSTGENTWNYCNLTLNGIVVI